MKIRFGDYVILLNKSLVVRFIDLHLRVEENTPARICLLYGEIIFSV